jgi:biopolymer transport protein ExbD
MSIQLPPDADDYEPPLIRRRARAEDEDEMDLTPMVDVTFLLLIFFIMTAAFSLQKAIQIPPTPEETAQNRTVEDFDEDQDYVIVRIDADNVFWVNDPAAEKEREAASEVELLAQLRAARAAPGGPTKLLVLASGDARHEYVVAALDAGTAVGMEEVKLASLRGE